MKTYSLVGQKCNSYDEDLVVNTTQKLTPCCMYKGDFGNISEVDISKANWALERPGLSDENCYECLWREGSGIISRRMKVNEKPVTSNANGSGRGTLELNLSNICNFDCVMCTPRFSSKWEAIDRDLGFNRKLAAHRPERNKRQWITQKIIASMSDYSKISFLGGEPLADPEVITIIQAISDLNVQPVLRITTNGSLFSPEIIELLKKIKNLDINVSIDGIEEYYEFIRGFNFNRLISNLKNLRYEFPKLSLSVSFTTSTVNILHLPHFLTYFEDLDSSISIFEMSFRQVLVGDESPFSTKFLSADELAYIIAYLKKHIPERFYSGKYGNINNIYKYLEAPVSLTLDDPEPFHRREKLFHYFMEKRRQNTDLKYLQLRKLPFFNLPDAQHY